LKALVEQLHKLFLPIIESEGVELIALELKGKVGQQFIKVFVDVPGGITLGKCQALSRQFLDCLDMEDIMPGKYRLEVSSPGVNRPLKTGADFYRNVGREVKVVYQDGLDEESFEGKILEASNETVQIEGKKEIKQIPISKIVFGKIKLPW
jgi:ribosome maturation factor RimP